MRTREELIAAAARCIELADSNQNDVPSMNAYANVAQACVMLAKELREGENAPTFEQVERLIVETSGVASATWAKG
jgi:hypothetical protein